MANTKTSLEEVVEDLNIEFHEFKADTEIKFNTFYVSNEDFKEDILNLFDRYTHDSDYRINQVNTKVDNLSIEHIKDFNSFDERVSKYERMLQDITTDSHQITMDNGEIQFGVWTILSQARAWDLEILNKVKGGLNPNQKEELDEALRELQNKLPHEQGIIDKAIELISTSPDFQEMDSKLGSALLDIEDIRNSATNSENRLLREILLGNQNNIENINKVNQDLINEISKEVQDRVVQVERESTIRQTQYESIQLELGDKASTSIVDAISSTISEVDGKVTTLTTSVLQLDNAIKDKADASALNSLTVEVNDLGNEVSSHSTHITNLNASLNDKADTTALNSLSAKVIENEQGIVAQSNQTTQLSSKLNGLETSTANALNSLDTKVSNVDGRVTSVSSSLTQVQTKVDGNIASIATHSQSINGIEAEHTIKTDVNGLIAGYGLINKGTSSVFAVNASQFYIGTPNNNKKPFIVLTQPGNINGVTVPAGTYIDTALIANATITNAQIHSLHADKITAGTIASNRITVGADTTYANGYNPKVALDTANSANSNATSAANAASTAQQAAITAISNASSAQNTANTTNNQVNAWKFPNKTTIDGGKIETKTIRAEDIIANNLSSLSATIGILRTATSGSRMEIRDNVIKCYEGEQIRVQLGNLSL